MLGDTGRVNFSHTLSPESALSPAQVEAPGDVSPAISPREVDFSCPEPPTGCWGLQVLTAWRRERDGPRELLTVSMDSQLPLTWQPLEMPPKLD